MNQEFWHKAEEIAAKNYFVVVNEEKDSKGQPIYLASIQEFYGCMAQGQTKEEALVNLKDASIDYIYSLLIDNINIPEPTRVVYMTSGTNSVHESTKINDNGKINTNHLSYKIDKYGNKFW